MQFFYDEQIRRYLTQFMRIIGGFSVKTGKGRDGTEKYIQVPVRYGDINRMAAHIMKNQSENMINTVPFISCYITDMQTSADRRTNPTHVSSVQVYEKKFDPTTGQYIDGEIGNTYTIDRHMPVPYDLTVQVDIWTSNTDQKFQLMEQLTVLFNPSINLKLNDNPFDWTNLSYAELTNVVWSVRQVPQGTDDIIDVAALNFNLPIYISPPARVRRQTLIHTILTDIKRLHSNDIQEWRPDEVIENKEWVIVTFEDLKLQARVEGNTVYLLNSGGGLTGPDGNILSWSETLKPYGDLRFGISNLRLRRGQDPSDPNNDIIATISELDSVQPNLAYIDVDPDSLPSTTIGAVNAIVDPTKSGPGKNLPLATIGQRYLVVKDVPESSYWGSTSAKENDIIEFNGTDWVVSFNSGANSNAVVLNITTNMMYEWRNGAWISIYEGTYKPGYWRLYL